MTISLNFNTMKASPSLCLGRIGEHNATDLEITWTNSDERIASYRVAFQTGGKSILSDSFSSMPIEVALWQQLTLNPRLSIQIIAYDVNGDYIGKSDKFCGLYFAPSVSGINTDIDSEAQDIGAEVTRLEAEVADNTAARHTHSNKTVLDKFGETSGTPTYDGEALGGGLVDDVRNSAGQSLVVNKIATIPDAPKEIYELWKSDGVLNYTFSEILNFLAFLKPMTYEGNYVVYVQLSGAPQTLKIHYLMKDSFATNYSVYFDEYSSTTQRIDRRHFVKKMSTEDYTTEEQTKLSGIESGAEVNVIDTIKTADGTPLTVTDKSVTLPAIPAAQIQSDWEQSDNTAKDYIKNKPSIPAAQVQADWNESDNTKADYIKNKPDLSIYAQSSSLATVATSGSYNDLSNTPTIPTAGTITSGSTGYATGGDVYTELQNIPSMPSGTNTGDILVWNGSAWVAQQPRILPPAYQPVDYLESSGTQYIDTGIKPSPTTRFVVRAAKTATGSFGVMGQIDWNKYIATSFGEVSDIGNKLCIINLKKSSTITNSDWLVTNVALDGTPFIVDLQSGSQKANGVEYGTRTITESAANSFTLFSRKTTDTSNPYNPKIAIRIYSYECYLNGVLAQEFIPCIKTITGDAGFYDTVNGVFYTNQGTGSFVVPT